MFIIFIYENSEELSLDTLYIVIEIHYNKGLKNLIIYN